MAVALEMRLASGAAVAAHPISTGQSPATWEARSVASILKPPGAPVASRAAAGNRPTKARNPFGPSQGSLSDGRTDDREVVKRFEPIYD